MFSVQFWLETRGHALEKRTRSPLSVGAQPRLCPGPPTLRAVLNVIAQAAPADAHEGRARGWTPRLRRQRGGRGPARHDHPPGLYGCNCQAGCGHWDTGASGAWTWRAGAALLPNSPSPHLESIFRKWQLQFRGPVGPRQVPERTRRLLKTAVKWPPCSLGRVSRLLPAHSSNRSSNNGGGYDLPRA